VGNTILVIEFDEFIFSEICDDIVFTYTPTINGSGTMPSFMTFIESDRTFMISSNTDSHVGIYEVVVNGTIPDGFGATTTFYLEITERVVVISNSSWDTKIKTYNQGAPKFIK
jgi:hypothetical protein